MNGRILPIVRDSRLQLYLKVEYMPTRNVILTDQQSELVDELVREGRYQNASEVLREGSRLLADSRADQDAELDDIRAGIRMGLDQANAGDFASGAGEEAITRAFESARNAQKADSRR